MSKNNLLVIGMAVFVLVSCSSVFFADDLIDVKPGHKHLFLDDFAVQEISGLTRTMHQPEKRGAVLKPDILSDGCRVQVYGTSPMWDEKETVYKLVYQAYPMDNFDEIGAALAISKDGIHWEKPNFGQEVLIRGSVENNRIYVEKERRWGANALMNVIYDPDDPDPSRRYKGLLGSVGRCPVVSADAITWRKLDVPLIPSSDTSSLMYDRPRKRYVMFGKTGNRFGRAAAISISEDFENWSKPVLCFGADEEDQKLAKEKIRKRLADPGLARPLFVEPDPATGWKPPEGVDSLPTWRAECYHFTAFPYADVYVGLVMMYYPTATKLPEQNNTDGFDEIQLVMNRDLKSWDHLGQREAFIPTSRIDNGLVGVFDRQQITAPGAPLVKGDELWFYYTGMKTRIPMYSRNKDGSPRDPKTLTTEEKADLKDGWSAICLAVLRLDGFISLDARDAVGYVLTKPFKATGAQLFVNIDAGKKGSAQVELLDQDGQVLPGFARDDAVTIKGDGVRQQVVWQTGSYWGLLNGETIQLKIYLKNKASLYAFWAE